MTTHNVARALLVCGLLAIGAAAQSTGAGKGASPSSTSTSPVNSLDKQFIRKAAEGGMAEVEMGKLASEKGSAEDVKKFGQRMVDDHSKADDQLKQIAGNKGITLPDDLNAKDKALKGRLEKMSGTQFDRGYMNAMVKDHIEDIADFSRESKTAKDPDVRAFATQTLPTLKDHLKNARSVASQTGSQASVSKTSDNK